MGYYTGHKRILIGNVPCRVAPWVGELGNDAEYQEAVRPRDTFKAAYYTGGYRITKDGIPCRLAAYVADWSPRMKSTLLKGTAKRRESDEITRQAKALGLSR